MPCWNKNIEKRRFERDEPIAFKNLISNGPMAFYQAQTTDPFHGTNKILKKCVNRNWKNVVLSHFGATREQITTCPPKRRNPCKTVTFNNTE
mmetsp:Transcript_20469/g.25097  ORF Transcript_20469/g.25097 Transcript_20469/m.25097 type:complete len:92 (-) Transcript_20469:194-469(-)